MKFTLAIPNGSLHDSTVSLLATLGMRIVQNGREFVARLDGSEIFDRVIIMRPQDMPEALVDGMVDAAIYGLDWHMESGYSKEIKVIAELNYSKKTAQPVKLVVFGQSDALVDEPSVLVTSEYMRLASEVFRKATIRFSHGGTEQKVAYGNYDYGVCVTETGESLHANGLKILKTIMVSPTILAARDDLPEIRFFGELLQGALKAKALRLLKMNVESSFLSRVLPLLPSLEAPTVNQLADGNCSIETVVPLVEIADLIIRLRGLGVSGIITQEIQIAC